MTTKSKLSKNVATLAAHLQAESVRLNAALQAADGGYCDFFVEGGGKPFHEKCPTEMLGFAVEGQLSGAANAAVEKFRQALVADDGGYCDFFVENGGDGKPFHEKCQTFLPLAEVAADPAARVAALSRSAVIQTLARVRAEHNE